ncbi:hypothetical protein PAXRUDRAFT_165677, partial [Paxillus rubicundulus Ve08.2h10]
ADPVPKSPPNDQQQGELDYHDLPTSRRPITPSHRPPATSATAPAVKHVKRFWHEVVAPHSASSPAQQAIELQPIQDRHFGRSTEVTAGHAENGVVTGSSVPGVKRTRHYNFRNVQEPQSFIGSSAADTSLHAGPSGSTSNAGPIDSHAGPSTSDATPVGRRTSFAQSNAGSDNSRYDVDCDEQCADYFSFGPWRKKSRAVIEDEERAKKGKKKADPLEYRGCNALKTQNAIYPLHHQDRHAPQADHIKFTSPSIDDSDYATNEPVGVSPLGGAVPQAVLPLEEQIDQLRRQLDESLAACRKADAERERLEKEVKELRFTGYEPHKSLDCVKVASSASLDADDTTFEPLGNSQLGGTVHQPVVLPLQDQPRQQVVDLLSATRKADPALRNLQKMGVNGAHNLQDPRARTGTDHPIYHPLHATHSPSGPAFNAKLFASRAGLGSLNGSP